MQESELKSEDLMRIRSAMADGDKIGAIHICMEAAGADLFEAKEFVERIATDVAIDEPEMVRRVSEALADGNVIQAVRIHRDATGQGLRESKEFVEALIPELVEQDAVRFAKVASRRSGCFGLVLLLVTIVGLGLATTTV